MNIENSFQVAADPDHVFHFLVDVNRVVGCVPGAELSEVVDPTTFKGKVRIKVGPVTVAYNGTARISSQDDAARSATLEAEGRETTGPGSARATTKMTVTASDGGSTVALATDYTVAGRVAQFGRGVMEDVSKRLVNQMAACIKQRLEADAGDPPETKAGGAPHGEASGASEPQAGGPPEAAPAAMGASAPQGTPAAAPPPPAAPVNALGLFFSVLWDRIRRLFGGGR